MESKETSVERNNILEDGGPSRLGEESACTDTEFGKL
jgi:hypothetical protein